VARPRPSAEIDIQRAAQIFSDTWAEIEPSMTKRPDGIQAAKLSLANIVLSLAKDDTSDPEPLKNDAVRIFRLKRPIAN
jgi:hypothetical protein